MKTVFLIEKEKPDWQKGLLNGVGGKIEPGETPLNAMRRESIEECAYDTKDWIPYGWMGEKGKWNCGLFYAVMKKGDRTPVSAEGKPVIGVPVKNIGEHKTIENLPFLIHAALAHLGKPDFKLNVHYASP